MQPPADPSSARQGRRRHQQVHDAAIVEDQLAFLRGDVGHSSGTPLQRQFVPGELAPITADAPRRAHRRGHGDVGFRRDAEQPLQGGIGANDAAFGILGDRHAHGRQCQQPLELGNARAQLRVEPLDLRFRPMPRRVIAAEDGDAGYVAVRIPHGYKVW